jgi:hypothetical protein
MTTKYVITAPAVPGAAPTRVGTAETLADARKRAREFSRRRRDLRGQDVRIERPDGQLVEYAGIGP